MLSDFDTENMSKAEKLAYYMKNYGAEYTLKKALKKFGIKTDPESEYMAWCRRTSYSRDELKAEFDALKNNRSFDKYSVLLAGAEDEEHSRRNAAKAAIEKASLGSVNVIEVSEEPKDAAGLLEKAGEYVVLASDDAFIHEDFFIEVEKAIQKMPEADLIYSDEDSVTANGKKRFRPYFKPDRSPMLLLNFQYLGSVITIRKSLLLDLLSESNIKLTEDHWYGIALETFDRSRNICHISKCLFSNIREDAGFVRSVNESQKQTLLDYVKRKNIDAEVIQLDVPGFYHLKYNLKNKPKVSVIIPNMDHIDDLKICVDSLFEVNDYDNIEVVIAENNSKNQETFDYYKSLEESNPKIKVVYWKDEFNYSAINDFAVEASEGDMLLFLNNDTKIINPEAIEELVTAAIQPGFGASGAMLYYGDDTIQHAGVIIGMGGFAAHALWSLTDRDERYYPYSVTAREMGAATGACLMVRREAFEKAEGFDKDFRVALNDIDLCMKIRKAGYEIAFTPYAKLYHYESKSRGYEDTMEKQARFQTEIDRFQSKWEKELLAGDEYYNKNLTLHKADFSMDI